MIDQTAREVVQSLSRRSPTPGGGAAAAVAAAMGAALLLMVVRFSRGKKANVDREAQLCGAEELLDDRTQRLLPIAQRDCDAFDRVSAAYKLPKDSPADAEVRAAAIEEAMMGAMAVPEETLAMIRDVLRGMKAVVSCVGKAIASDLGSGTELLRAGAEAAYMNVRINAASLKDRELAETTMQRVEAVRAEIKEIADGFRVFVDSSL